MPHPVRNADLCALLDGECRSDERKRIQAELTGSPQCAERLALWRRNDAALRFAVSGASIAAREPTTPAPFVEAAPAPPPRIDEPLAEVPQVGRAHDSVSRSAHAAAIAAFAGGAGAGLVALAVVLLAR